MKQLKAILRPDILALCGVVFLADFVMGVLSPTFSIYAQSLGASLALIGLLGTVGGFTRMFGSMPIGLFSDTHGRKLVIVLGMFLFALSTLLYTLVSNPYWLLPIRILQGLAVTSTFFIGVAYLGDTTTRSERGVSVGLYTTAMGLGFTVGPFVGGFLSARYGIRFSYRVTAAVALVGFLLALVALHNRRAVTEGDRAKSSTRSLGKMRILLQNPQLLAASLANLLMGVVFGGAIVNFFPLYAASLALNEAAIGSMFAARGLVSTLARLPTGVLTARIPSRHLMIFALALAMAMSAAIAFTGDPRWLGLWLVGEGISFGMFLTAGQSYITELATDAERGSAIGLYSTAGSVGSAVGPFAMGLIAQAWTLAAVFQATALLVLMGLGLLWLLDVRQQRAVVTEGHSTGTD